MPFSTILTPDSTSPVSESVVLPTIFPVSPANNREKQIIDFNKFIANWNQEQNLVFVTHYVVISEILKYAPSSGEIVISNKNYKLLGSISNIK